MMYYFPDIVNGSIQVGVNYIKIRNNMAEIEEETKTTIRRGKKTVRKGINPIVLAELNKHKATLDKPAKRVKSAQVASAKGKGK